MLESFKHYGVFLVIALFIGSVLLSNRAGVNLTHHHNLPQMAQKNKVYCSGLLFKHCSVRLTTSITTPEDYQEVLEVLSDAGRLDTITFYLHGGGGQGDSMVALINGIKATKAHTVAVVQGDVQSAHAALAISMDEMQVGDNLFFMFHRSSLYGKDKEICDQYKDKTDRTQSLEDKCKAVMAAQTNIDVAIAKVLYSRYLTDAEVARVLAGNDVIIESDDMKNRHAKHNLR